MKRTVKAWVVAWGDDGKIVRADLRDPDFKSRALAIYSSRATAARRRMGALRVFPCVVTFEQPHPTTPCTGSARGKRRK